MKSSIEKRIIICPKCSSNHLLFEKNNLKCLKCKARYTVANNQILFDPLIPDQLNDPLSRIKLFCKKYPSFYYFLVGLISPVYFDGFHLKRFIRKNINDDNIIGINLGSGNSNLSDRIINIDFVAYKNVDVVCRSEKLPIKSGSVDVAINLALLEHVPQPEKTVAEIFRVLKKGGKVYCFFPFIQGFHASPFDYQRRTAEGVKELYYRFKLIELRPGEGPTSGFLWIFQEYIAIVLSFGFKPLYLFFYFAIMLVTFPLKFLDILLIHNRFSKRIAGGFIYVGEKG
jgi:SAM-dependent methyltransferase